jgi:choline dehydrogenase-like flavoprotein
MPRLSLPIEQIKRHYTVVVVGSGYGGAIAAWRMARAGQTVCLLERGKELQPRRPLARYLAQLINTIYDAGLILDALDAGNPARSPKA